MPSRDTGLSRFELWLKRKNQAKQNKQPTHQAETRNTITSSDTSPFEVTQSQNSPDNKTHSQLAHLSASQPVDVNPPSSPSQIESQAASETFDKVAQQGINRVDSTKALHPSQDKAAELDDVEPIQPDITSKAQAAIPDIKQMDLSALFHGGEFDAIDPLDSYNMDYKSVPSLTAAAAKGLKHWQRIHNLLDDDPLTASDALSHSNQDSQLVAPTQMQSAELAHEPASPTVVPTMLNELIHQDTRPFAKARAIAMDNTPEIEMLNPSWVTYQSQGQLLITLDASALPDLNPEQMAQLVDVTSQLESRSLLILNGQTNDEKLSDWLTLGAAYYAQSLDLTGHLGAFLALTETQSAQTQAMTLVNLASVAIGRQGFDLVLDFTPKGLMSAAVPAIGYYPVGRGYPKFETAMDELPGLIGEFDKPKFFHLETDLCAHSQRGLAGCERCIDACPAGALTSEPTQHSGRVIQINPNLCQGVGTCATACPNEAIRYAYPEPEQTQNFAKTLIEHYLKAGGQNPILLFCSAQHPSHNKMLLAQLPANVIPVELEELPSVGMDTWFQALTSGACQVLFAASLHMPQQVRDVLSAQVGYAQQLLTQLGLAANRIDIFYLENLRNGLPELIQSPLTELSALNYQQVLSREQTQTQTREVDANQNPTLQKRRGKQEFDFKDSRMVKPKVKPSSPKRQRLFEALDQMALAYPAVEPIVQMPVEAAFGSLDCDGDKCTLCMGCVSVCPTGALKASPDSPSLQIKEQDCVQCGLCVQGCPEQALALKPQMNWQAQTRQSAQVLHQEKPALCLRCDKPFAPASMIDMLQQKLAANPHFSNQTALRRIAMCEDCRVKDRMQEMIDHPEQQGLI
ncbi:MAG: 4Fe-4S binding protein [Vibrio sp.]